MLDCDVLQAGGTRTACFTGAYVALVDAISGEGAEDSTAKAEPSPDRFGVRNFGGHIIDGPMLDPPYTEDVRAETDMNVVVTGKGKPAGGSGHCRGRVFDRDDELNSLLDPLKAPLNWLRFSEAPAPPTPSQ